MAMTIDHMLTALGAAKRKLGGGAPIILSLTDSELPDSNVDGFAIENTYFEIRVEHVAVNQLVLMLDQKNKTLTQEELRNIVEASLLRELRGRRLVQDVVELTRGQLSHNVSEDGPQAEELEAMVIQVIQKIKHPLEPQF